MTTQQHTTPAATRPSGSPGERAMSCNRCGGEWSTPAVRPEAPFACPFCNVHVCACGCGEDMSSHRSNAIWAVEAHGKQLKRAEGSANPDITQTQGVRTVAEARAIQEDAQGHWTTVIREGIVQVLAETGYFHADDLSSLGIPDTHRRLISGQVAKVVNQGWVTKVGERKSIFRSRNAGKSGIYQLTSLGRKSLAGVDAGGGSTRKDAFSSPPSGTSVDPGEGIAEGVDTPGAAPPEPSGTEHGTEEEQLGEGTAGPASGHIAIAPAPSTGPSAPVGANPSGAPTSSDALPGLEPTAFDRMKDAA